jgi:hypothetical protein
LLYPTLRRSSSCSASKYNVYAELSVMPMFRMAAQVSGVIAA